MGCTCLPPCLRTHAMVYRPQALLDYLCLHRHIPITFHETFSASLRSPGLSGTGPTLTCSGKDAGAGASGWTHPCCCSASRGPDPAKLVKHLSQSPRPETQSPRRRSGLPRSRGALHDVSPECVLGAGRGGVHAQGTSGASGADLFWTWPPTGSGRGDGVRWDFSRSAA